MDTLCGQAYGAKQYDKVGMYMYTAIISLIMICVPICVVWIFMDKLLILMKQDPLISHEMHKYSISLIPALFGDAFSKPLVRYLQTQTLIFPMLLSSFVVLLCHTLACWTLVYKLHTGTVGAAVAFCMSNWLDVLLSLYVKFSTSCKKTRVPFSVEAFYRIGIFFRLAIPSVVMVCLKWWSFEALVLLCVLLPNPKLDTSVLSICTHVSNELGAGNPKNARVAVSIVIFLIVIEAVTISIALFFLRHVLGRAFSNKKQVVDYFGAIVPFICISVVIDSLQVVISGVARGSGWQNIRAYINLGAFYGVGIPFAVVLGFTLHLKANGFWIGILGGSVVQATILSLVTGFTNWQKQAMKAKDRLCQGIGEVENNTLANFIGGRRGGPSPNATST